MMGSFSSLSIHEHWPKDNQDWTPLGRVTWFQSLDFINFDFAVQNRMASNRLWLQTGCWEVLFVWANHKGIDGTKKKMYKHVTPSSRPRLWYSHTLSVYHRPIRLSIAINQQSRDIGTTLNIAGFVHGKTQKSVPEM